MGRLNFVLFIVSLLVIISITLSIHHLYINRDNKSYKLYETTVEFDTVKFIKSNSIKKIILPSDLFVDRVIFKNDTLIVIFNNIINNYYK